MLYHEVLEKATPEDITMFIANRNLDARAEQRANKRKAVQAKAKAGRRR